MQNLDIPIKEFMIESFLLKDFIEICSEHSGELICNIIGNRYDSDSDLSVINYAIIQDKIYFFLRWRSEWS